MWLWSSILAYSFVSSQSQCNYAFCQSTGPYTACPLTGFYAIGYCNTFTDYSTGDSTAYKFECLRAAADDKVQMISYRNSPTCDGEPISNETLWPLDEGTPLYSFACDLECQPSCNVYKVQNLLYDSPSVGDTCKASLFGKSSFYMVNKDYCYVEEGLGPREILVSDEGYNATCWDGDSKNCTGSNKSPCYIPPGFVNGTCNLIIPSYSHAMSFIFSPAPTYAADLCDGNDASAIALPTCLIFCLSFFIVSFGN